MVSVDVKHHVLLHGAVKKTLEQVRSLGRGGLEIRGRICQSGQCLNQNQNQNIYCPSISLQGNLSYGAQ